MAAELDDVFLQANACWFGGWGYSSCGELDRSIDWLRDGYDFYRRVGDAWRLTFTNNLLAWTHARRGDVRDACRLARDTFEQAVRFGQFRLAQSTLEPWAAATLGRLPFAELSSCIDPVPDDLTATIEFKMAETWWHIANQSGEDALRVAEQAVDILRRNGIRNDRVVLAIPNLAHAIRLRAEQVLNEDDEAHSRLRNRQLKAAKWAVRRGRWLRFALPYALRELALAHQAFGRIRKAHTLARRSVDVATRQNAKTELAQSLLLCGQLGAKLGRPEAAQQIEKAQDSMQKIDEEIKQVCATFGGNTSYASN